MPLCPICGRTIGHFSGDPILATPSLSTDRWRGFTQLVVNHIVELQNERHGQEISAGVTPLTIFSPINSTGKFQDIKPYILELRNSVEKILAATGQSLHDFLSKDENGNPMTSKDNWTDANLLEDADYQCKAIHIEDLRHNIVITPPPPPFGFFYETWEPQLDYSFVHSDSQTISSPPPTDYNNNYNDAPIIGGDRAWNDCFMESQLVLSEIATLGGPFSTTGSYDMDFTKKATGIHFVASSNLQIQAQSSNVDVARCEARVAITRNILYPTKFKFYIKSLSATVSNTHSLASGTANIETSIIAWLYIPSLSIYQDWIVRQLIWDSSTGVTDINNIVGGQFVSDTFIIPEGSYYTSLGFYMVCDAHGDGVGVNLTASADIAFKNIELHQVI